MMRRAALILSVALLPLFYNPLRFEGHETFRAGLLIVLVAAALPGLRPRIRRDAWPLLLSAGLWAAALLLSTGFALSPARALAGDSVRRMGLLMQLVLMIGLVFGAVPATGRWFWFGGLAISAYVLLQAFGLIGPGSNPLRPTGPLGASVFTAGWLALGCLWLALGGTDLPRWQRWGGVVVMVLALVETGSRGVALALLAGGGMAALVWAAVHRSRRIAFVVGALVVGLLFGFLLLPILPWQNRFLSDLPLVSRLNPATPDATQLFRERVWGDALALGREWPGLSDIHDAPDRFASLRPLVGYGLESFETLERLRSDAALRQIDPHPVDRAHNDWLDTLLTVGWLGVVARAALWGSAWLVALRRLGIWGRGAWLLPIAGAVVGGLVLSQSTYLPAAITLAALAGGGLWLFWCAVFPMDTNSKTPMDSGAWIALAVVSAHIVDLQFGFTTIATGWLVWLALGRLAAQPQPEVEAAVSERERAVWCALAGGVLARALLAEQAGLAAVIAILLVVAVFARPVEGRNWLTIVAGWSIGTGGTLLPTPEMAALWDVAFIVAALLFMSEQWRPLRTRSWLAAGVALLIVFWLEDSASISYRLGTTPRQPDAIQRLETAAARAPWDDRFVGTFGDALFNRAQTEVMLVQAQQAFDKAAEINPYDALLAWRLAAVYAALDNPDASKVTAYFDAALRLWPHNDDLLRARATFLANLARGTNP
jgi:O-antigen ligase